MAVLMNLVELLPEVCRIAVAAGDVIVEVYDHYDDAQIEHKGDGTPVTLADKRADALICEALSRLTPAIPLVTEESVAEVPFATRKDWQTFWLVDPLDGTKEFIERTGEFSVNIALVEQGKTVLGVVYVPVTRMLYCAVSGEGAYKQVIPHNVSGREWQACLDEKQRIQVHPLQPGVPVRVAVSRRHGSSTKAFMAALGATQTVKMGSAIKSCLVAEGAADVYPRFGPTSLWDTAAAQCVVEEAGGKLVDRHGKALRYEQSESLLNPHFMVAGDREFDWPAFPSAKS
ncbi:3'(2'),5'-bisphosphate nucleotidase CysQ [Thiomicrorhabdus cannonii]|uniref:3'(2'),5'-bisphosphate nucleotidase CysQ n=1 Tax=Thiomicrorhabdus cannonii TaxID=2748011 RepID=UPI001FE9BE7A|nr:3'(2'),5'-bisphosphate nucleotidase CysQ [Thiomicrorhabdus cannonii]